MAPLDVGPPTYTSRASQAITGTNLSTAMRLYFWDDNNGGIGQEDGAIYFVTPTGIHAQTGVQIDTPGIDTGHSQLNLHMLNPIGYNNKPIMQVLLDFLMEQMHVGCGSVRLLPAGSGGTATWIPSSGSSPHAGYIDEPMDAPAFLDYLATSTAGATEQITFPSLPSNALEVQEAILAFWGLMTKGPSGSDEGLGFGFQMHHSSVGDITRLLYGDGMYADGTITAARVKLDRIGVLGGLPSVFNSSWLNLTAGRGAAGPSPNPYWRIYNLEMLVYYTNNDPAYQVVDDSRFYALDAVLDAIAAAVPAGQPAQPNPLLDFDVFDTTGYSALLDILAHAPQAFLYIDYLGRLRPGLIGAYADVATPRALSTIDGSIIAVRRGPYRVDERYANAVELRWGVEIPHRSSGTATEDPTNPPADRGTRKVIQGAEGVPVAGWEDVKTLDRHFIRRDANKPVAEAAARMYRELWAEHKDNEVMGMDLVCPYLAIDVEPGDVVALTIPTLGLSAKNYLCVEKSLDLDRDELNLTVYDLENTL